MKFDKKMRPTDRKSMEWKNTPTEKDNLNVVDKRGHTEHPHAEGKDLRPGLSYSHRHK